MDGENFAVPAGAGAVPARISAHLQRLEDEAIHVLREVAAQFTRPVVLYSVGKDSSVLLHLARKAFFPAPIPFPFLHVASGWDFTDLLAHRDRMVAKYGVRLLVQTNEQAVSEGVNPFDTDIERYTRLMLTEPLRQALDRHGFDAAIGGGRRDEEKSRAKERVFSVRTSGHVWNPRDQRPELWSLFNTRLRPGETMRVFPLSNWTELDVWTYIHAQEIEVVPLYFAAERAVVERGSSLIFVDRPGARPDAEWRPHKRRVRFRTLGCWPLTGAIESAAADVAGIVAELLRTRSSERQGRLVDLAARGSMEHKKREGYF
ncbi:MAG: sulfate adenylyltransferase subunit CysD [Enhydrobacter sp.]|nr:MAG: sulfate adenylyltransferase subunit CysD [Enhydrobacter sp.]